MSRSIELLCLASSFKPGGRCIAGIDLATGEWVRPVSPTCGGTIPDSVFHLQDADRAVRPLDQVTIGLDEPRPEPEQPENWLIGDAPWKLTDVWTIDEATDVLDDLTTEEDVLFGTSGRGLDVSDIPAGGVSESLLIAEVMDPVFYVNRRQSGSKQLRSIFTLGSECYDVPVTDLEPWAAAIRDADQRQVRAGRWRFTMSLSLRFNDVCYKLIAAGFGP